MLQVTNGLEAAYNFIRNSPVIELNDDVVGALAGASLTVRGTVALALLSPFFGEVGSRQA
jgi:hypothetical protein